jgi:hypothetical protein
MQLLLKAAAAAEAERRQLMQLLLKLQRRQLMQLLLEGMVVMKVMMTKRSHCSI